MEGKKIESSENIVVMISTVVQVGPESWRDISYSKVFSIYDPVYCMLEWAEKHGLKNPTINELTFSVCVD
jgi:hypothetical protein